MKLSCILVAVAAAQYDDLQNINAASMSLNGAEWTFGTPNSAHWGTMAIMYRRAMNLCTCEIETRSG